MRRSLVIGCSGRVLDGKFGEGGVLAFDLCLYRYPRDGTVSRDVVAQSFRTLPAAVEYCREEFPGLPVFRATGSPTGNRYRRIA